MRCRCKFYPGSLGPRCEVVVTMRKGGKSRGGMGATSDQAGAVMWIRGSRGWGGPAFGAKCGSVIGILRKLDKLVVMSAGGIVVSFQGLVQQCPRQTVRYYRDVGQ